MMGEMVSMECNYVNTPGKKWYVIQWKRRQNGTEPETIVTLQNNFLTEVCVCVRQYLPSHSVKHSLNTTIEQEFSPIKPNVLRFLKTLDN